VPIHVPSDVFAPGDLAHSNSLPVKENPLSNSRDGFLRFVQRRELGPQAVFGEGHGCGRYHESAKLLVVGYHASSAMSLRLCSTKEQQISRYSPCAFQCLRLCFDYGDE
jgi:hypothetical protein